MFYFFRFGYALLRFSVRLAWVRKKAQQHCTAFLQSFEKEHHMHFDAATFRKIVMSHSLYLPIVNDVFAALHGRYTSHKEQESSIRYFIMASVYDNFFDEGALTPEQIRQITFEPYHYPAATADEIAGRAVHLYLLKEVKEQQGYKEAYTKMYEAQCDSKKQFDEQVSNEELYSITTRKGGYSVLMCRYYLDVEASAAEEKCWYTLGSIIQFTNDLYDIYKDLQSGIQTLPSRARKVDDVAILYEQLIANLKNSIQLLPFSFSRKQEFSIGMAATYSFGLVAIDQLKRLQGTDDFLPDLRSIPRKALIVDMHKPANIWRWMKFCYRYSKLQKN
ncbi:MAG: hypothetical protein KGO81_06245 [Bacteroidota bacterium]|nr:hypothetical protein [Bacteroidota bacterium]